MVRMTKEIFQSMSEEEQNEYIDNLEKEINAYYDSSDYVDPDFEEYYGLKEGEEEQAYRRGNYKGPNEAFGNEPSPIHQDVLDLYDRYITNKEAKSVPEALARALKKFGGNKEGLRYKQFLSLVKKNESFSVNLIQIFETATAEFMSSGEIEDYSSVKVDFNGKKIGLKRFLDLAKTDSQANKMLVALKKEMQTMGFNGNLADYILVYYQDEDDTFDIMVKNGMTKVDPMGREYKSEPIIVKDNEEREKNKTNALNHSKFFQDAELAKKDGKILKAPRIDPWEQDVLEDGVTPYPKYPDRALDDLFKKWGQEDKAYYPPRRGQR